MTESETLLADHYPDKWDEFVGQDQAKRQLRVAAKSAQRRGVHLGHVLLSSPVAGIGKTSLALLTAKELGVTVKIQSGKINPATVRYIFADLSDGDVLFLDEIHRLVSGSSKAGAEWLLHYLQDGVLMGPLGVEDVPQVTIIGATTDAGRLPTPVLERFEIAPTLERYTDEEGAQIAHVLSRKILVRDGLEPLTDKTAVAVATAGNNGPRMMRRILCAVRDLVVCDELEENGGDYDLTGALQWAGVTADGLTAQAQKYLITLYKESGQQPLGFGALRERVGEVGNGMVELERLLLDKELVQRTKAGRMLTTVGFRRTKALLETGA